ncbi:hypothetical protein EDB81DRAFT_67864 [Dactylonectria macrodidyma]|uniref:Zn(2)-C6 fungal-type domain-containing protein n=1 Tax=Dactylonectria macrodidyma TaxID=307937 RepID=A0A9P9ENY6_9HYPO|nr:hypothetical protein EDB81DRAFT_67864 [Dactylonectria macrodidyma]
MSNPTDNPPTSTPPDNPPTIPADDSHDKESEPVSQDKTLPRRDPLSLNGPPPFHYGPPQPYGPPPLGAPHPAPLPFTGFEYSAAYYREKRKASRASQACTNCRQLKAKCDEQKPCQGCKDKMLECQYRDPPLSKSEREMKDISTKLDTVQGNLDRLLKCLPVFAPSRGRQPALTSLEACLGSQEPIAISPAQREILQDLKTAFSQLREYDNWDTLGPRLVW